ncbi:alpha/beta fold hydrolase [Methylotenera sp.]|uniref:alpha/beta fold hydrolase n=1 Tax=Methylotenera sp. TaxID=2051956 RepID=UPI0027312EAA|nr:alpha/beta hydrolase [Methylotenera sp.]MDP2071626.1 alpha/beta hydrolase [Methylotenera sp.]MDP3006716.1 alpha/beta hydrolase [Methylotenera sp.]
MRHLTDLAKPGQYADTLVILLPGAYQQPEDFIKEGFVQAVRQRQLGIDLIMAELSFSHIADQSALSEIYSSLIQPAIAAGYQNIWLAGISIGGYVAMAYAGSYPEQLAGLLLLAPYPGNRMTTGEIAYAGGLQAWAPDAIPDEDIERLNWHWLKTHVNAAETEVSPIEVHLSYGEDDRFAESHLMIAQILPATRVDKIPGDHVWPVWQQLWHHFLDKRFGKNSHD